MEPKIKKNHLFLCTQTIRGYYRKGRVYESEKDYYLSKDGCKDFSGGFITNDRGDKDHFWPFNPQQHPLCHDSWTDYFKDLGGKPKGVVITPYAVGDTVKWHCDDDDVIRKSKILGINIECGKDAQTEYIFYAKVKFKGSTSLAAFTMKDIRAAY